MNVTKFSKFGMAVAVATLAFAAPTLAAEIEAKKSGVEIYSDATNKSDTIGTMKEGESLKAGERKGMFWAVTTKDGKSGFVSVLAVKRKADTNSDLTKAIKGAVKEGRGTDEDSDARARSAVMGVRGLAPDDNMANAANVRPNLRAVFQLEDMKTSDHKVEALGEKVFNEIAEKSKDGK